MARGVERDGADRLAAGRHPFPPAPARLLGDERLGVAGRQPVPAGELLRGLADQKHLVALDEDGPRQPDRVAHPGDGAHRTRFERVAGHDRRVHLDDALHGQHRAEAGVEERVVLEDGDRRDHRVEGVSADGEHRPARLRSALDALPPDAPLPGRLSPRATVHGDRRHGRNAGHARAGMARRL